MTNNVIDSQNGVGAQNRADSDDGDGEKSGLLFFLSPSPGPFEW